MRFCAALVAFIALIGCGSPVEPAIETLAVPAAGPASGPFLWSDDEGVLLSWIEQVDTLHALRFSELGPEGWSAPRTIASGDDWFVNWADVPSIARNGDAMYAHWLARNGQGRYAYGVRIAYSRDGGATWSEPEWLHEDQSPSEHGFASLVPGAGGARALWLDGRLYGAGGDEMMVMARSAGPEGWSEEVVVDERACDCCPTAMVALPGGDMIAAYRDRTEDEIRDIAVARRMDGRWESPRIPYEDNWQIAGCPVNGPALAAHDDQVALAWFAAPGDAPRVQLGLSLDGGATFGEGSRVDLGQPIGRVDVAWIDDQQGAVTWLEADTAGALVLVRPFDVGEDLGAPISAGSTANTRASGYPRLVASGEELVVAWTAADAVMTARIKL